MGGCSKTLKFVITIITWVGVTKKWNCLLLFVTNLWCSHFFCNFSTSQARKKICFFLTKGNCQRLVDFGQLWNKKMFYCLAQQHCCLDKKQKKLLTSFVCFLLPSFWKLRTTNNSEKDKTKKRCFFFLSQVYSVLATGKLCLKQNEQSFVI